MTTDDLTNAFRTAGLGTAIVLFGIFGAATRAIADDWGMDKEEGRIRRGFEIAPVPLDLKGKDRALVGLGSYLVNAVASCNDCHSTGPAAEFSSNPYFKGNPPKVVNQAVYLAGGRDFGSLIPGTPDIMSRNLTPDKTGLPVGGRSFAEFLEIMRTGVDLDHLHPNCTSPTVLSSAVCFPQFIQPDPTKPPIPQPFNGDLLQVMPWPIFQSMKEHDFRAIYEYLKAIPCIAGPPTGVLHNDCT